MSFSRLEAAHTARLAAWDEYQDADREIRAMVKATRVKRERENAHAFDCAVDEETGNGCDCRGNRCTGDSLEGGFRI